MVVTAQGVPFASLKVIMTACSATEWTSQRPLIPHGAHSVVRVT